MLLDIEKQDPVLTLAGEVDASNADELARVLESETREGGVVAVDLDQLAFLDACGVHALIDTADRAPGRIVLCRPNGSVRRVLDVVNADRVDGVDVVPASPTEVVRELFMSLAACETPTLQEMLSDDAVWHVPGNNAFSGTFKGKDEILGMVARMKEFTSEYILEVEDVVAGGGHAAVLANLWGDRDGKILFGSREIAVFRVQG